MVQKIKASVIIPCRNEEKFIGKCLDSVIKQDWPKEQLEALVIDGKSDDNTKKIAEDYSQKIPYIKVLDNSNKFTPFGLNIGIKNAKGSVIVRMDAHTEYDNSYIKKCINYLYLSDDDEADDNIKKYKDRIGNVGGVVALPPKEGFEEIKASIGKNYNAEKARAIAICLSHPFGSASRFRVGNKKPIFVDTVFCGCYKKEIFNQVGLFNENLIRSQDLEFNLRLKRAGWKILLIPEITFNYYPKDNFTEFFQHNFLDGIWAIYPFKFTKTPFRLRHYLPLFFVLSIFASLILSAVVSRWFIFLPVIYLLANLFFSLIVFLKEKDPKYLFFMPIAFICRHFGYGLGSIWGLMKLLRD